MTFTEKFDSLKIAFDKADLKKFSNDFALQMVMTDEDCGGIFYIEYKNGVYSVEPYDYVDNTATVTASSASFAKLAKGVVAKDLVIDGNATDVKTLASSLKVAKAPAKKTCAKKPCAKKTCAKKTETKKTTKK